MSMIIGRALIAGGGGTVDRLDFTYTGDYNERLEDGVVEFLTTGVLKFKKEAAIDAFLVGGGSGGCPGWYRNSSNYGGGGGGGGGKTTTLLNIVPRSNTEYQIIIGAGGSAGTYSAVNSTVTAPTDGGDTTAFGTTAEGGRVPTVITPGASLTAGYWGYLICGGSGGSGGGQSVGRGITSPFNVAGAGGSDGSDGGASNPQPSTSTYPIGTGQGTTTREFGEATGKLYSGGGGAGNILGSPTAGGAGGGGNGGGTAANMNGVANTGGGGGGQNESGGSTAGAGGSGIVCIRLHKEN